MKDDAITPSRPASDQAITTTPNVATNDDPPRGWDNDLSLSTLFWKPWQLYMLLAQGLVLSAIVAVLRTTNPHYLSLLWQIPLGIKMLLCAGLSLVIGTAIFLFGCAYLNRTGKRGKQSPMVFVLVVLQLVLFFPAVFVVLVGPEVIIMIEQLHR